MHARCTPFTEKGLDLPTAMSGQSMPDDQQLAAEVLQQVLQKADDRFTVKRFVLWSAVDLGYLAAHAAAAVVRGDLKPGDTTFNAGRLGEVNIADSEIILGDPTVFNTENIDAYDF